jgi:hypothetical protein
MAREGKAFFSARGENGTAPPNMPAAQTANTPQNKGSLLTIRRGDDLTGSPHEIVNGLMKIRR